MIRSIIAWLALIALPLWATTVADLYILYDARDITGLQRELTRLGDRHHENSHVRFFYALMEEDAETAVSVYKDLFQASEGRLKREIALKLSEYYYAKGFYVKSEEYLRTAQKVRPDLPALELDAGAAQQPPATPVKYVIQVGAFGHRDNADRLSALLRQRNEAVEVVARKVGGKTLYCVWIDGRDEYDRTRSYAEQIKEKYNLPYRILTP